MTSTRSAARLLAPFLAWQLLAAAPGAAFGAEPAPARGMLLVASTELLDPNFGETVVLLVHYSDEGAAGLIVNRPLEIRPLDLMPEIEGLEQYRGEVFLGGPVAFNAMSLLWRGPRPPQEAEEVMGGVYFSDSRETLEQLTTQPRDASRLRLYIGHAGWAPGQLDAEIARGDWRVIPASSEHLFDPSPGELWKRLTSPPKPLRVRGPDPDRAYGTMMMLSTPSSSTSPSGAMTVQALVFAAR